MVCSTTYVSKKNNQDIGGRFKQIIKSGGRPLKLKLKSVVNKTNGSFTNQHLSTSINLCRLQK